MRLIILRLWILIPITISSLLILGLLFLFGTDPIYGISSLIQGALGTKDKTLSTLAFWIPLLLASTGLLITFTAGLWNIGVEGQMVIGAIATTWVALYFDAPRIILIVVELIAAMVAGAIWAAFTAVLKTKGKVNEIFGGLALTNLAIIFTNYLISGPWQPPEGGTFRGTQPFHSEALLPLYANSRFSPISLILAIIGLAIISIILSNTTWGLKLKGLGKNPYSAYLLGISSEKETILAMAICGALAGLGGAVRVLSWFDSLRQSVSGGIGYLALLVVMLAAFRVALVPFIALFFSIVLTGSIFLQLKTQLHSSIGGILTGILVLLVLLFGDKKKIQFRRSKDNNE